MKNIWDMIHLIIYLLNLRVRYKIFLSSKLADFQFPDWYNLHYYVTSYAGGIILICKWEVEHRLVV